MKAAVYHDYAAPVEIAEVAKPVLQDSSVLIEVHAASLNPIDNILRAGYLRQMLELSSEQVDELILLSRDEVAEATSLYQFTREINAHYDHDKKMALMTAMWRVALADGHLDKHEEGIIRRVADLLYIRHNEYIRCKLAAKNQG